MRPDELIHDLYCRYMHSIGNELQLIHASVGFKKLVRKWMDENNYYNFASEWKWMQMTKHEDIICGVVVRYDINRPEVILLAKA